MILGSFSRAIASLAREHFFSGQVGTPPAKRVRRARKDNSNDVVMTVRKFSDRAADFVRGAAEGVVLYQCAWKHGGYNSADYGLHITIPEFLATRAEDGYPATLAGLWEAGMKLVFTGAKFGIA